MNLVVADDDSSVRELLQESFAREYELKLASDGAAAWDALQDGSPMLAVLEWSMPTVNGLELCRRIRASEHTAEIYVILITSRNGVDSLVRGFAAGADDYMSKPIDVVELRSRLRAGCRILQLQMALHDRIDELQAALDQVKRLKGLLPICSYCKRIRKDRYYWQQLEAYISENSEVEFTHGICPECYAIHLEPALDRWKNK